MGSGGSGDYLGDDPRPLIERIRDIEQRTTDQQFEADVSLLLSNLLTDANNRPVEAIAAHLRVIQSILEKDTDGFVDLMFGGSVAKHTYVHGVSDVDALVILNNSELAEKSPEEVCSFIQQKLAERLVGLKITRDEFAVKIHFSDVAVEIVPAIRDDLDFKLPDRTCTKWSRIRPRAFSELLTNVNRFCNGKLVPMIKLVKALNSTLPENRRLKGYHIESLAIEIFQDYQGSTTLKQMLQHFFEHAPLRIQKPITDVTKQTRTVDEGLGPAGSLERMIRADAIGRLGRRMKVANVARSLEQWQAIFGFGA